MHGDHEGPPGRRDRGHLLPGGWHQQRRRRSGPSALRQPYKFFFMDSIGITLTAKATMRLEQPASMSKIIADNAGVCT